MGDPEVQAIRLFARHEGLLLDPVYTPSTQVTFWWTTAIWAAATA